MKKIYIVLILFIISVIQNASSQSQKLPDNELKYLAVKFHDPECVFGIFRVPLGRDPMRKLKVTNDYPESDTNYIHLAINKNLMKLDVLHIIKGETDSMVFIQVPFGGMSESGNMTFYSYPGTEWIMVMNKGLINNYPAGWVKDIKDLGNYKWINVQTAFVADAYTGNYNLLWNKKFEMPDGIFIVDPDFKKDLELIYKSISNLSDGLTKEDYNIKINEIKSRSASADGKRLCDFLMK